MQINLSRQRSTLFYILFVLAYFYSGQFLSTISFHAQIMPVWLPAGIGLMGCYYYGWRFLPGLFLASFSFNYSVHPLPDVAALFSNHGSELVCIALGASLQGFVGSELLKRFGNPVSQPLSLNVIKFIFIVGLLVNLISANIGIFSLSTFQSNFNQDNYWVSVLYWWLGDSLGVLLMAPFLLSLEKLSSPDVENNKSSWVVISSVIMLTSLVLVLTAFFINLSTDALQKLTDKEVRNIENSFYRELNNSLSQIHNLASYIQNTPKLNRENFDDFVKTLIDEENTIQGMSWNPVISQEDKSFEESILSEIYGQPVTIKGQPLGPDDPIVYVKYISPEEGNAKAIGFNVFSNEARKRTLIQAEASFQPVASQIINLVQSDSESPAYLMYFPIFSRDFNRLSESGRKLRGYATGIFLVQNMIENALNLADQEFFKYELYEKFATKPFSSNTGSGLLSLSDEEGLEKLVFNLAGQSWYLSLVPNEGYLVKEQARAYLLLFLLEVVIVTFIMLFILIMNGRQVELNQLVKERTHSLDDAMKEAEKANLAKSRFLANMSHEIRTPLNAVVGFSELASKSDDIQQIQQHIEKLKLSSDMLLNLVNDILDFSKIESGKLDLCLVPVNLSQLVKRISSLFESVSHQKSIDWKVENMIPEDFYFLGDQARIEQILMNLCSNAIKFTKEGAVCLSASMTLLSQQQVRLTIKVKDTGIGIDDSTQKKLFSVFTQADDSTTRNYGGSGLGLAIAKELSQLMNGDIYVQSKLEQGAEFTFEWQAERVDPQQLPAADEASDPAMTEEKKTVSDLKVLVAEDNRMNQLLIQNILTHLGIEMTLVENGQKALEALAEQHFDLVLMDCQMPVMDGYDATQSIRSQPAYSQLPVIALTADADTESRERAREIGFTDYLTKPIDIDKLIQTLESYV